MDMLTCSDQRLPELQILTRYHSCLNKAYSAAGLQPVMDAMAEPFHCYGKQATVNKLVYTEAR